VIILDDKKYDWKLYPKCEEFLLSYVQEFLKNNTFLTQLSDSIDKVTGTRFFDWIDHIVIPNTIDLNEIEALGFSKLNNQTQSEIPIYAVINSILPPILINDSKELEISLKVDNIEDFCNKNNIKSKTYDKPYSPFRKIKINSSGNYILSVVERHGSNDFTPIESNDIDEYQEALNAFFKRNREFQNDEAGITQTQQLVDDFLAKLSTERTADAFFQAERMYWQDRCPAGNRQAVRQDTLGLGWANHDHHTFRCSRENFSLIIHLLESLGFVCRERFYAGVEAGWGAQVLEHPVCKIAIFADADITEAEKDRDFAHTGLQTSENIGTVGLWVDLHGESLLQAGLHHLAVRTNFESFNKMEQMMKPFSNFDFLKQAFSVSHRWMVEDPRLKNLVEKAVITNDQNNNFAEIGAIGSHIESIQRSQGFKGFNQDSITAIIHAVDPRKN
jgi:hypothetical protein